MSEKIRVDTFKIVYGVESLKEVSEQFREEYKKIKNNKNEIDKASSLFQKYVLSITFLYSVPSIKNNLKLYRKIILEEGGVLKSIVRDSFYIFDVYKVVSSNTDKKIVEKEESNKEIAFNVKEEILRVKNILDNNYFNVAKNQTKEQVKSYYLAYILGLATGRRFTEIFKTVSIRKKGKGFIYNGILKKDKNEKALIEANFLFLSADETKSYLKELRAYISSKLKSSKKLSLKDTSESQINTIFSKVYNNAVKRISEDKIPNFHELRHYYTIEGTIEFKRDNESDKDTRYRILGHHIKNDSTRTYATIK